MAQLLQGEEFLQQVRDVFPDHAWDEELSHIIFGYKEDYENYLSAYDPEQIPFDTNRKGEIYGLKSYDGKSLLILSDEDISTESCHAMFYRLSSLIEVIFNNFDTSECTDMSQMFKECSSLLRANTGQLLSDNVTDFSEMFDGCCVMSRLDMGKMYVPTATAENGVNVDNMLRGMEGLRIIVLGDEFGYSESMGLSNPNQTYISHTNGLWNNLLTGASYNASSIPMFTSATYYAIDVRDQKYEDQVVTLGVIADMIAQLSNSFVDVLRVINTK